MANDIDIIVGVKDLATNVLNELGSNVSAMAERSQIAFTNASAGISDRLRSIGSAGIGGDSITRAINEASRAMADRLDAAVVQVNQKISDTNSKIQAAISSVTNFVAKAAKIASIGAAFFTLAKFIAPISTGRLTNAIVANFQSVKTVTDKAGDSAKSTFSRYANMAVAAGATATLVRATQQATTATNGLLTRVTALGRGGLAAFVLANAMKKTESGASTLTAKLAKVAGAALAFEVVARSTIRLGLHLLGIGKKADDASKALSKTATAGRGISETVAKISSAPIAAVKSGATSATLATTALASRIDDLPAGAESVNALVSSFGGLIASVAGVPALILAIPAAIAGVAFAAYTAAAKTERQLVQLTDKLALVEAAKLNVSIDEIDTAPLRKVAEETAKVAMQIQAATNVKSSDLLSQATKQLPKGLDPDQIGPAMKAAVGLAEVYGTGTEEGFYKVRQAIDGNFESFEKLIPSLKDMATNDEKLAAVSLLAANGFKIKEKAARDFWGTIEKVKNGFGNLLQKLGDFTTLSEVAATVLTDIVTPAVEFLDIKLKGFGFDGNKVMSQVTSLAAGVVSALEVISNNWGLVFDRLLIGAELFWVQLKSHAVSFVTNTLPWIGENFEAIFQHVFANITKGWTDQQNIMVNAGLEAYGLAAKGSTDKMITDSVNNTKKNKFVPKEMTELKGREISSAEKEIQSRLDNVDGRLKSKFDESFKKNFKAIDDALKGQQKGDGNDKLKGNEKKDDLQQKANKQKPESVNTVFESRILTRGSSIDVQKEMLITLKQSKDFLKKLVDRGGFPKQGESGSPGQERNKQEVLKVELLN